MDFAAPHALLFGILERFKSQPPFKRVDNVQQKLMKNQRQLLQTADARYLNNYERNVVH